MSSEKPFKYEDSKYSSSEKSSVNTERQLDKKCISVLLFTVKKFVASMKFSMFLENFEEIYKSHPDDLKEIHKELQMQLKDKLKSIVLNLFIKHDVSFHLSLLDSSSTENESSENNESVCLPNLNSINHINKQHNTNKILMELQNIEMCRNEKVEAEKAIKRSIPSTAFEKHGQDKSSANRQLQLKHSPKIVQNEYKENLGRSPSFAQQSKFHHEKQRLNSVLSKLCSYNEALENKMLEIHEDVVSRGNNIQDTNEKLMVELDELYNRYIFEQNNSTLAIDLKFEH